MSPENATYLDFNAGAPLHPEVVKALLRVFQSPGSLFPNPSSIHSHGRLAKRWVSEARDSISKSLGSNADPEEWVFTSSGTEANQMVIRSLLEPRFERGEPVHWITSPVEHDSVMQMVPWVRSRGGEVSFLGIDEDGVPIADSLEPLLKPTTALVSVLWVSNETGAITPLETFSKVTRAHSIPLHSDAAQVWGKIKIDAKASGADFLTFSAHKIGALAGVGGIWVRPGNRLVPFIFGKQEKGRRGGTENLAGIVAVGAAAQQLNPLEWDRAVRPMRDWLENEIQSRIPNVKVNGAQAKRVGNTLNLSFDGIGGEGLVMALDLAGFSLSSGSACSSGVLEPSHVLLAMGRSRQQATAALRISISPQVRPENLKSFVEVLAQTIQRMRDLKHSEPISHLRSVP